MEIKEVSVNDISPAKYNPRTITDKELQGLKNSIETWGFVDPIIVNKSNMVVVGGHQRLKAAKALGKTTVPVNFVDLGPTEEKALNIALNSHTIQGKFDLELLPTLLEEIKEDAPGFIKDLNLDVLEEDLKLKFEPDVDFDDIPDDKINSDDYKKVTFTFSNEQVDILNEAVERAKFVEDIEDQINKVDDKANALTEILKRYLLNVS